MGKNCEGGGGDGNKAFPPSTKKGGIKNRALNTVYHTPWKKRMKCLNFFLPVAHLEWWRKGGGGGGGVHP